MPGYLILLLHLAGTLAAKLDLVIILLLFLSLSGFIIRFGGTAGTHDQKGKDHYNISFHNLTLLCISTGILGHKSPVFIDNLTFA